ncbi:hypothetical protein BCR32DRAFT_217495 [Anaeromyces robustus]|uniref:CBM10 domain-containing protein n=1 Tax=Anaeromyces robustus TaxID=1754192 RepID=A0A1Y1XGI8_9FUNG|nr:hypothetical protein BCR32DRAFT_217495 [Anaeromyces robustus]|eukprot:ORX84870.1 hypothetical protein BCR32DRAFT_217495 [Anaeromyces robustus]
MKSVMYFIFIFIILINAAFCVKKGSESSFSYKSETTTFKYSELKDIVIFGDSYTTVSVDFETMTYTGLNLSGGKNWPQFLIDMHLMKMWNYAVGGACVDLSLINGDPENTPMTDQYAWFLKNMSKGKKFANWDGDTSLFVIWFGINDINGMSGIDDVLNSGINEKIATSIFNMVEGMYKEGAKNFLFIYVPSLVKFPAYANEDGTGVYNENLSYVIDEVPEYNNNLNQYAKNFQEIHPDTNVFVYNAYDEFDYIMENKSEYGIVNIRDKCSYTCNMKTYFWNDNYHPTAHVHKILAKDINTYLKQNEKDSREITHEPLQENTSQDNCWSLKLGYSCCTSNDIILYSDADGDWSVENNEWCGIIKSNNNNKEEEDDYDDECWADYFNYKCCSTRNCRSVYLTDANGDWDIEDGQWCGITSKNTICK